MNIQLYSANTYYTISGFVRDSSSGEELIGSTIYIKNTRQGTITNNYGFYSISLPEGEYQIEFNFVGYKNVQKRIFLNCDINLDIELAINPYQIKEVAIEASTNENFTNTNTNQYKIEKINLLKIKEIPSIFGTNDIIKILQTQNGIKNLGDASSGFYVRGGNLDQNLILIDEAPIYNQSHLFGLVSIFNSDVLKDVTIYESNMPANYGGRLSSVIDARMKEGDMKEIHANGGIDILTFHLSVEIPIIKENSSCLLALRRSYYDFFIKPSPNQTFVPKFYDINFKTNIRLNKRNRVFLSFYNGFDKLTSYNDFINSWGNSTFTFRWNKVFLPSLFHNLSIIYSDYVNNLQYNDSNRVFNWLTGIKDFQLKSDFSWYINTDNKILFGFNNIIHKFIPGETNDSLLSIPRISANEMGLYVLQDCKILSWLGINYGFRYTIYNNMGVAIWYVYNDNYKPIKKITNREGFYSRYNSFEPRINISLKISKGYALKLNYTRSSQFLHLLQNNSTSYSSLQTWIPVNPNIKPQFADIFSTGLFIEKEKFSYSIEAYYKFMQNQIDFIEHAKIINNPYIESILRSGKAESYGIELSIKKLTGKITGNIYYSYSHVLYKISGINNNKPYPALYDIPHDLKILLSYKFNDSWVLSSNFIYFIGHPFTFPIQYYQQNGYIIPIYTGRNESRFPDYHRLDFNLLYQKKSYKRFKSTWSIGIFNIYARKNPSAYKFVFNSLNCQMSVYKTTYFTIIPNISYTFKF
jgi:hypothetical protein